MFGLIALASALLAAPAPPPSPADSNQIVVEGVRQRDKAIHDFVTSVTPAPIGGGQLRRYQTAVCPAAVGLPEEQNRRVAARLADVARAVGIPLAPAGCGPNALVVVVDNKDEFVAGLRQQYPDYFYDAVYGRKDPPREQGPAIAWHVEGLLTADHIPAAKDPVWHYYMVSSTDSSRLRPQAIPHFMSGVVVIERRALAGLSVTQLADYAAMRLYATTDPTHLRAGASSILGVLDAPVGTPIPITLTSWDLSFLRSLYTTDDRQFANRQRNEIERAVSRDDHRN